MTVLAIDTAFGGGGVALAAEGRILAELYLDTGTTHSKRLLPSVHNLLDQLDLAPEDITGLAVNQGPGFFTGLRIGLATSLGLALGLGLPTVPVSSLRLLAAGLAGAGETVWAVADARRGLVYAACFAGGGLAARRLSQDAAIAPQKLAELIEGPAFLAGDGARLYSQTLCGPGVSLAPPWTDASRPGLLALLGEERLARGLGVGPEGIRAKYCRPSDAEIRFGLPLDGYNLVE